MTIIQEADENQEKDLTMMVNSESLVKPSLREESNQFLFD